MDDDRLLSQLVADGPLLRDAAVRAGWDTTVPGLDWTVRELVVHTGAVHRWSADIVARALPTNETGGSHAWHPQSVEDDALAAWFDDGHRALVATLDAAEPALTTFTFTPGIPAREFWIRRQAHETAIHRVDAEAAAGRVTGIDPDIAQDGIVEITGFARNRAFACSEDTTLALAASDGPSWLVDFGGERITAEVSDEPGDATVSGTSAELYRWLWNRPSPVTVDGDSDTVALWRRVTIT